MIDIQIPADFPAKWVWCVADRYWSAEAGGWIDALPEGWSHDGERRPAFAPDEIELTHTLRRYALPGPQPVQADYEAAVQAFVDQAARERGYRHGDAVASYSVSTVETWAAEAAAFTAWRDSVWLYAFAEMAKVDAGERPQPSIAELISELTPMQWPG